MRPKTAKLAKQHSVEHNYKTDDGNCMWIRTVWVWNGQRIGPYSTAREKQTYTYQKTTPYKDKTTTYIGRL